MIIININVENHKLDYMCFTHILSNYLTESQMQSVFKLEVFRNIYAL